MLLCGRVLWSSSYSLFSYATTSITHPKADTDSLSFLNSVFASLSSLHLRLGYPWFIVHCLKGILVKVFVVIWCPPSGVPINELLFIECQGRRIFTGCGISVQLDYRIIVEWDGLGRKVRSIDLYSLHIPEFINWLYFWRLSSGLRCPCGKVVGCRSSCRQKIMNSVVCALLMKEQMHWIVYPPNNEQFNNIVNEQSEQHRRGCRRAVGLH